VVSRKISFDSFVKQNDAMQAKLQAVLQNVSRDKDKPFRQQPNVLFDIQYQAVEGFYSRISECDDFNVPHLNLPKHYCGLKFFSSIDFETNYLQGSFNRTFSIQHLPSQE
jgi:hypothetical protein